jgi:predicted alpha/beta superfamily hydrolase
VTLIKTRTVRKSKLTTHKKKIKVTLPAKEKIGGVTMYHHNFFSQHLHNSRTIIVWLPPGYLVHPRKRYPVLYMHDGQNILDPKTAFVGVDWEVDECSEQLIREKKITPFIIVGIYNTPQRLAEYGDTTVGEKYRRFITEEVKPFIDSKYRTKRGREHTGVMGSSLGGLCSLLLLWKHNDVFSKAACLSSSFYFNDRSAFRLIRESKEKKDVRLYFDSGEDGKRDAQKMFALLIQKGYRLTRDIEYYYASGAQHTESAWANRLMRPLTFLFPASSPKQHSK